jgi:hypothetical protein
MTGARDESDTVSESSLTPVDPSGQVGEAIRGRFPVFRDKVYVNSCSQGALSDSVRAAYEEYLDGWDENGAEWEHWVERSEAARAAFATLLGAAPDDVAIQTSVSAAVSGLVSALQFRGERNRIVISENEFPTIGQIAHAQELRGAEVVQVEPDPEAYAAAIDERTALVASTFVSFRTGAVHDVEAIYGRSRWRPRRRVTPSSAAPSSTCSPRPGCRSWRYARGSSRSSCRCRRAGSRTKTSSTCRSSGTGRTGARAGSTQARRRCRTSTPASPGSG